MVMGIAINIGARLAPAAYPLVDIAVTVWGASSLWSNQQTVQAA